MILQHPGIDPFIRNESNLWQDKIGNKLTYTYIVNSLNSSLKKTAQDDEDAVEPEQGGRRIGM